jgi:hypothetical protein
MPKPAPLTCSVEGCHSPFGRIENGALIVEAQHHGEKHVCTIGISELILLANIERVEALFRQMQLSLAETERFKQEAVALGLLPAA